MTEVLRHQLCALLRPVWWLSCNLWIQAPVRRAERDYPRDNQDPITSCNHPTTSTTGTGNSPATPTPNHSTSSDPRSLPDYSNDPAQKKPQRLEEQTTNHDPGTQNAPVSGMIYQYT